jgi:catechol 2,3-dioxygenase-like lactoylglutathione lyase family enzyme
MALDHLSFGTCDLAATRSFYEGQLGFAVIMHELLVMDEGGRVEHIFFDCGGDCALAFMQWIGVPGVPTMYDTGINRGLGVPLGTFHFAFRVECPVLLRERRCELLQKGVAVGELLDLNPYASFFFDDPVNGLRLEYTTRYRPLTAADRDPEQRRIPANLKLFEMASKPSPPDQYADPGS